MNLGINKSKNIIIINNNECKYIKWKPNELQRSPWATRTTTPLFREQSKQGPKIPTVKYTSVLRPLGPVNMAASVCERARQCDDGRPGFPPNMSPTLFYSSAHNTQLDQQGNGNKNLYKQCSPLADNAKDKNTKQKHIITNYNKVHNLQIT